MIRLENLVDLRAFRLLKRRELWLHAVTVLIVHLKVRISYLDRFAQGKLGPALVLLDKVTYGILEGRYFSLGLQHDNWLILFVLFSQHAHDRFHSLEKVF